MPEDRRQRRLRVARGEAPADLVLAGGQVANVYTGQWQKIDVALYDGIIAGLGDYGGPRMEVQGGYIIPGLIDGHLHLESSMLTPRELARALLPLGTTTLVADPHEIANVWGTAGLDYVLAGSAGLPLDFFFMLPSCVPASPLETAGARLEAADLAAYRRRSRGGRG
jgi:adenine deaminase